ncbi:uncharacterized protein [Rutidosis leptorrhynchoides]|uniref:uncharacterized protein n=1 Tax=Rutidosis leptorrhynchoides TaxID=125765 RepID=UPI003A99E7EB
MDAAIEQTATTTDATAITVSTTDPIAAIMVANGSGANGEQTTNAIEQTTTTTTTNAIEQTTTTTIDATVITTSTTTPIATIMAADGLADYGGDDSGPKDITITNNIAKGKRTKRQRPQSPIIFTFSSTNISNMDLMYSPVSSSSFPSNSTTTEDQDTAESLILLSKGISLDLSTSKRTKDEYEGSLKFNSKKFIQSSTTGSAGIYVYECKTCSRTFSSFQALGGHRASHRKPKNTEDIRKPQPYTMVMDSHIEQQPDFEFQSRNNNTYSSFSYQPLQLNNRVGNMIKSSSKLHECAICGTEFNSGQALGGHMRRHRVIGGGNKSVNSNTNNNNNLNNNDNINNNTTLALIPYTPVTTTEEVCDDGKYRNDALCLSLDLNLPAPRESAAAVGFSPAGENEKEQQPSVHLSATPTLVDCHY